VVEAVEAEVVEVVVEVVVEARDRRSSAARRRQRCLIKLARRSGRYRGRCCRRENTAIQS